MARKTNNLNLKVVLLGEGCVGKTSLVVRYIEDTFNDKHVTTLQASFLTKKLNLRGKRATLSIWDTAGQERFHALGPIYYRDANGAILVYDITDQDSFQKVKSWVKELRKMLGKDICLAIAGNKVDLDNQRRVDIQMANDYAKTVGAQHFHTSAKTDKGVEEMFLDLTQKMIANCEEKAKSGPRNQQGSDGSITIMDDDFTEQNTNQRSKCCGGGGDSVVMGLPVDDQDVMTR